MMSSNIVSDHSRHYQSMLDKLDEIELALDRQDASAISRLALDVDQCLEGIKKADGGSLTQPTGEHRLMVDTILEKNREITSRIREMTALQRNELNQLKVGRETAKGYALHHAKRTGSIINSSK